MDSPAKSLSPKNSTGSSDKSLPDGRDRHISSPPSANSRGDAAPSGGLAVTSVHVSSSSPDVINAERALARLRQLAIEERAAVASEDFEALCHLSSLLPSATEALLVALQNVPLSSLNAAAPSLTEIKSAHAAAEIFLDSQMRQVSDALKQFTTSRRAVRGYGSTPARPRFQTKG